MSRGRPTDRPGPSFVGKVIVGTGQTSRSPQMTSTHPFTTPAVPLLPLGSRSTPDLCRRPTGTCRLVQYVTCSPGPSYPSPLGSEPKSDRFFTHYTWSPPGPYPPHRLRGCVTPQGPRTGGCACLFGEGITESTVFTIKPGEKPHSVLRGIILRFR